ELRAVLTGKAYWVIENPIDPTRRRRNSSWRRHQLKWVANRKAQMPILDFQALLHPQSADQLEPGCAILMHNKVLYVLGLLEDEVDPM
ncbi:26s proteasome regulatory subunit 4 like protein b, partial [Quercus suber]